MLAADLHSSDSVTLSWPTESFVLSVFNMRRYLRGGPLLEMGGDRQTSRWFQSNQNPFKCEKLLALLASEKPAGICFGCQWVKGA